MTSTRFDQLLNQLLDTGLDQLEQTELREELQANPEARQRYWLAIMQDRLLQDCLQEKRGQALAQREALQQVSLPERRATVAPTSRRVLLGMLAASLLGVIALWQWPSKPGAAVGKLQTLSGNVSIREANGQVVTATSGTELRYGQTILVDAEDSSAEVLLNDGSQLSLEADSVLVMPASKAADSKSSAVFFLERGGLAVDAKQLAGGQQLAFSTAHTRITVLGTQFRLYSHGTESRVELNSGSIELHRQADQQQIRVSAGEFVRVAKTAPGEELPPLQTQSISQATYRLEKSLPKAGRTARFSHDGKLLGTARQRELRVWNMERFEIRQTLREVSPLPEQIAFTADDRELVGMTQRGQIVNWDWVKNSSTAQTLPENSIRHAHLSADGSAVVQAINAKPTSLAVWSLRAAQQEAILQKTFPAKPWSAAISPAGPRQTVASAQWDGEIVLFDAASGETLENWRVAKSARPVAISTQSRYVAAFSHEDGLTLFERKPAGSNQSREGRILWNNMGARVRTLVFSNDERLILAGMDDGLVRVWSTLNGEQLLVLETGNSRVVDLDLTADGKTLATVGNDDAIKLWSIEWPELREVF